MEPNSREFYKQCAFQKFCNTVLHNEACDAHRELHRHISGIRTWNKNNNSPRLTVEARVAAKRQNTTHHNEPVGGDTSGTHGYHTTTSTSYYVTFEVESRDRMEFSVYGKEYGMLAEGDEGKLTFQGSRYLGFERAIEK